MARRVGVISVVAVAWLTAAASPGGQTPASAEALFDRYVAGEQAAVIAEIATRPDFARLGRDIARRIVPWSREGGGSESARVNVAVFLLDVAASRLETDWKFVRDYVEVGCRLMDPVVKRLDAARRWHLAANAVVQGAVDRLFLLKLPNRDVDSFDHLAHSRLKFPDEPRFMLAEVVVPMMAAFDQIPARDRRVRAEAELLAAGVSGHAELSMRRGRSAAHQAFIGLLGHGSISAEATLRAGYAAFQLFEDAEALARLEVASKAADPFVAYNAHLVTAMLHTRKDDKAAAERSLRRALEVVPLAQSATQMLASQLFLGARQAEAQALIDAWLAAPERPADPWRMFGYGDFRMLPALLAAARADIQK